MSHTINLCSNEYFTISAVRIAVQKNATRDFQTEGAVNGRYQEEVLELYVGLHNGFLGTGPHIRHYGCEVIDRVNVRIRWKLTFQL